eukprot:360282-Chlamydomonas_euryale.AAC.2
MDGVGSLCAAPELLSVVLCCWLRRSRTPRIAPSSSGIGRRGSPATRRRAGGIGRAADAAGAAQRLQVCCVQLHVAPPQRAEVKCAPASMDTCSAGGCRGEKAHERSREAACSSELRKNPTFGPSPESLALNHDANPHTHTRMRTACSTQGALPVSVRHLAHRLLAKRAKPTPGTHTRRRAWARLVLRL